MNLGDITDINVNAFDGLGNMFSSVKGFRFHWKITDGNVVQLLKLSQEKVKVGSQRLEVEKKHHSDIILLKGINTGKVILTAEILEQDYTGITSEPRKLYAVEPFDIFPSEPLYILPNNTYNFNLELISTGNTLTPAVSRPVFVIPNNRHYYKWGVNNTTCGTVKNFGEFYSYGNICQTKIIAEDTRVDNFNTAVNSVNVVSPTAVDISLIEISTQESSKIFNSKITEREKLDIYKDFEIIKRNEFDSSNTWKLVAGRTYLIKNVLMYEQYQVRYSLNTIKFNIDFSNLSSYIESLSCIHGNEICLLVTKQSTPEYLTLDSSVKPGYGVDKVYSIRKNVKIFSQLKIEKFGMKTFSLPYLGYFDTSDWVDGQDKHNETHFVTEFIRSQELRLIVSGGTGNYLFNSENLDVIQIRAEILFGKLQGKAVVKVTDADILTNFDYIEVEVREVKDIDFIEERQEIGLAEEFYISPIALKSTHQENLYDTTMGNFYTNNAFTNCTNLRMNHTLSLKDKQIKQIKEDFIYRRNSNYDTVRNFISENTNLLNTKLNKDDRNIISNNYLDYINFGICDSRGFKANSEGLIRLSFLSQIHGKKAGSITKILSSHTARVYIYSSITLMSPKFDDIFTKELLTKANIADPHKFRNFLLAVGSGVVVKLSGGIIPWAEHLPDYKEDIYLYESSKNRTSAINQLTELKVSTHSAKEYYIECLKVSEEREIMISVRNEKDKTLPRPGKSAISINIQCQYPKSLSVFFLGTNINSLRSSTNMIKDESLNDVFAIPQKEGIEYFEKKNSVELARVYAFDSNKRIFYNITSLKGNWTQKNSLMNKKLFDVMSESEFKKYINNNNTNKQGNNTGKSILYDTNFNSPEYIHSNILFENEISKFDLEYKMKSGLSHHVTINLIDFPTLIPNNITAYLSSDNLIEVAIENGSGDFDITLSDNTLAKIEYSVSDRKIILSPLKQGQLFIYVKDNKINNGFRAVGTVYISAIKRIQLLGGGLLMVNNTMPINLRVYDYFDHIFPESQVKKMNLAIGDFTHTSRGLHFDNLDQNSVLINSFSVQGLIADVYTIYVRDLNSNLTSNNLRVEVFDKLEVFPPALLLVPGSAYTLSIRGGPVNELHVMKKYQMLVSGIATVGDNEPEVKAHLIGKTVLRIILTLNPDYNKFYMIRDEAETKEEKEGYVLAVEEVNVHVDFPDSVTIRGAVNRKIYTKSTVRLFAALKLGEETFTYGVGPFKFDWDLDNTLIAKLKFYKSYRDECTTKDSSSQCKMLTTGNVNTPVMSYRNIDPLNSLGVFLTTGGQGIIDLKLTVSVTYPDPYQWKRPSVFVKHEKILIQDEIYVNIPEFYENIPNKSSQYLIPLDVDHDLHTNKNNNYVKYSVISQHGTESNIKENVISLSESGRVTTFYQTGIAHVLINQKDKENPAFIPVVLPVFVTDFYSLFAERSYGLIDMEVGQEVTLKVMLQHEYGLLFADGKFERFKLRSVESHPRIAKAELIDHNSQIRIRANSKGETNIIIFHPKTMQVFDVFQISVFSSLVLPEKILINISGSINFLKKDEKRKLYLSQDSQWISDNESIFSMDRIEGFGQALKEGVTQIHLISKDKMQRKLSTTIVVVRVKKVNIDRSKLTQYLTDIKSSIYYQAEYKVPIAFYLDESGIEELSSDSRDDLNEINHKINFKCTSNNPEVFTAETYINSDDNKGCVVKIRDMSFNVTPPANLDLVISVESKAERSYDQYTYKTSFKLPFISSFRIKNKVSEITFTKNNRTGIIYVDNLKDVEVIVEDESLLKVEVNSEEEDNYVKLYVPHNVTYFKDVKLTMRNRITGQKEEVLLNYAEAQEVTGGNVFFGLIKRDTLIDFITLVILIVTIWILYNYLRGDSNEVAQRVMQPNYSANRGPLGSGITGSAFNMNK